MFNQDEGKIECAVGNREICFWQGKKAGIDFISNVGICGIYLSLALGTWNYYINHLLISYVSHVEGAAEVGLEGPEGLLLPVPQEGGELLTICSPKYQYKGVHTNK